MCQQPMISSILLAWPWKLLPCCPQLPPYTTQDSNTGITSHRTRGLVKIVYLTWLLLRCALYLVGGCEENITKSCSLQFPCWFFLKFIDQWIDLECLVACCFTVNESMFCVYSDAESEYRWPSIKVEQMSFLHGGYLPCNKPCPNGAHVACLVWNNSNRWERQLMLQKDERQWKEHNNYNTKITNKVSSITVKGERGGSF
jgi:hypothetical protein